MKIRMKKLTLAVFLLIAAAAIDIASAATIHGTIYDLSLNRVKDVIVEINTIPKQTLVSKDGLYSFNVPRGSYIIAAAYSNSYKYNIKEEISVKDEGDYVIDLFLFPSFEEEEELAGDTDISIEEGYFEWDYGMWVIGLGLVIIIVLMIIIVGALHKKWAKTREPEKEKDAVVKDIAAEEKAEEQIEKKRGDLKKEEKDAKKEPDDYYSRVYEIIKKEKRATQKEIRRQVPLSEAKISLILTQLEHEGKVQKIKKGRGNIILFKQ